MLGILSTLIFLCLLEALVSYDKLIQLSLRVSFALLQLAYRLKKRWLGVRFELETRLVAIWSFCKLGVAAAGGLALNCRLRAHLRSCL